MVIKQKHKTKIAYETLVRLKNKYKNYPRTGLKNWKKDWQLLFSIILSAQSNDDQVNKVTKTLFKKYSLEDFISVSHTDISDSIRSIGFYNVKTNYLKKTAEVLVLEYNGKVPLEINYLIKLPGVGRKSANVFQGVFLGKSEGIAVDTHVLRMSNRLALSNHKTAEGVEIDLMELYKREEYHTINPILFWHGRTICKARKPLCEKCRLSDICPSSI